MVVSQGDTVMKEATEEKKRKKEQSTEEQKFHPVLSEVGIFVDNEGKNNSNDNGLSSPLTRAVRIFQDLLERDIVSADDIRHSWKNIRNHNNNKRQNINNDINNNKNTNNGTASIVSQNKQEPAGTTTTTTSTTRQDKEEEQKGQHDNNKNSSSSSKNNNIKNNNNNNDDDRRSRHIALLVYYDGSNYTGLSENVGCRNDGSVEREIFRACRKTNLIPFSSSRKDIHYSRSGRTDKGVSSAGQVIAMHLKSAIPYNATWTEQQQQQKEEEKTTVEAGATTAEMDDQQENINNDNNYNDKNSNKNMNDNNNDDIKTTINKDADKIVKQQDKERDDPRLPPMIPNEELPNNSVDRVTVWVYPRNNKNKIKKPKKHPHKSKHQKPQNNKNGDNTEQQSQTKSTKKIKKVLTEYPYDKMLNNILPDDIRVIGWCAVTKDFSARFSTSMRTYRYFFLPQQQQISSLTNMKEGLKRLVGKHDFRNFCKLNIIEVNNFVRFIKSATIHQELLPMSTTTTLSSPSSSSSSLSSSLNNGNDKNKNHDDTNDDDKNNMGDDDNNNQYYYYFEIEGQAFLWHQIRCIVSVMFMIGNGLEAPEVVSDLLNIDKYPGKPSYPLASELPLVLHDCHYQNVHKSYDFQYTTANLWNIHCRLQHQYEQLLLQATKIRNMMLHLLSVTTIQEEDLMEFTKQKIEQRLFKQHKRSKNNKTKQKSTTTQPIQYQQQHYNNEDNFVFDEAMFEQKLYDRIQKLYDDNDIDANTTASGASNSNNSNNNDENHDYDKRNNTGTRTTSRYKKLVSWQDAVKLLSDYYNLIPNSYGLKHGEHAHIPLLERHKGTTYEEKIQSLEQNSSTTKRFQRYEQNIVGNNKKRQEEEHQSTDNDDNDNDENEHFYQHMSQQGAVARAISISNQTTTTRMN